MHAYIEYLCNKHMELPGERKICYIYIFSK